jgi:3-oxoacyl-[acyl-carrier-protein] synthase II
MRKKVVITGMGLITPLRPFGDIGSFWHALLSGEDTIKQAFPPMLDFGRKWMLACIESSAMQDKFGMAIGPEHKLPVIAEGALDMALKDAAIEDCRSSGLCLGTVLGNILLKQKRMSEGRGQGLKQDIKVDSRESLSSVATDLAAALKMRGPVLTVSTACASGTDAIGIAARKIACGEADTMLAGGTDVVSDFAITGFHSLQAITGERVRPFDKNRSGLALGEGAAFVVLESEDCANSRGARIYGRVAGYASRADANHLTGPHREGRGLADAINRAMTEAGTTPGEIDYINAHGTGTPYNDVMETKAIKKALGKAAYTIPVSSIKSMLGHSLGAAGLTEAICCLLAIKHSMIPPTVNLTEPDPECDLDYVPDIARSKRVRKALSLSSGFGGQNSALLLEDV